MRGKDFSSIDDSGMVGDPSNRSDAQPTMENEMATEEEAEATRVELRWVSPFEGSNALVLSRRDTDKIPGLLVYEATATANDQKYPVISLMKLGEEPQGFSLGVKAAAQLAGFLYRWAASKGEPIAIPVEADLWLAR